MNNGFSIINNITTSDSQENTSSYTKKVAFDIKNLILKKYFSNMCKLN
jgi:hypothetical protein